MTVQSATSYSTTHGAAYAGMLADQQVYNTVSRLNKSSTVTIPFGYGVVSDGDNGARLPVAGSLNENLVGITMRELTRAYREGDVFGAVPERDFAVITRGVVYVTATVTVTKDQPVYLIVGDGTGTNQGKFSNVVGAGANLGILVVGAKWVTSAAAGALAQISLSLGG
ncbi:hypothetical protein NFB56_16000 [Yersinia ruckeri]|uniref:structural cement protein Gp24 n=1 Tax=Yersinia ruckeri TaxID=29486 RepID=UPI002237E45D|nr:hypothetical protein [Yersinia ruckeri]MCW6550341.1 hypothetical protein [Yersinia ruckeri]